RPQMPPGGLVYQQTLSGDLGAGAHTDSLLQLAGGQTLTLVLTPSTLVQARVQLLDPSGTVLASSDGAAAGAPAVLQTVPIGAAATYALRVISLAGPAGSFSAQVLLNAATETESAGGGANDTPAA